MLGRAGVPGLHEALDILRRMAADCPVAAIEEAELEAALGRILARSVQAPEDLPPFPRSTMDGYAVRAAETYGASETLPVYLKIDGEVKMGELPQKGPGTEACSKIATGGLLPPNTDAVVMFEHTVRVDDVTLEVVKPVAAGDNVMAAGDDVQKGCAILRSGHFLRPQDLGLLAALGITRLAVHRGVRVGIFSTGDEIVSFGETPPPGRIRDANSVTIGALARQCGAAVNFYGIVADKEQAFLATARKALAENDLIVFSGSSSVGSRDLGEKVVAKLGAPGIVLHGVAIKPGKPVIVARAGEKMIFGLPGHPVSAAVTFELFVRPAILHISGLLPGSLPEKRTVRARCRRNINSAAGRTDFVRVAVSGNAKGEYEATPILGKSGALSTLVDADGYFVIEESSQGIERGTEVTVYLY
ncbi:MAG: molybdopterin molybdotransferase MoeA [Deltaproteobacteria bacterium]